MSNITIEELILNRICPVCGKINCPTIADNKDYQKMCESYLKGDDKAAKKIYIQKYGQYSGMKKSLFEDALAKSRNGYIPKPYGIPYDSIDLLRHYLSKQGGSFNLPDIGISSKVRDLVSKPGGFGNKDGTSIESRFLNQFKRGERESFSNVYDFSKEAKGLLDPLWAIGGATIKGKISDVTLYPGDIATANITYEFYDKFTDPYDTFNLTKSEWNPNGEPFEIKDKWTVPVKFALTEAQMMRLLKKR